MHGPLLGTGGEPNGSLVLGSLETTTALRPNLVDVFLAKQGKPGLEYLDRFGRTVPW